MKFEEFVSAIKVEVETMVGMDMRVEIHTTIKNNGREKVGVSISDEKVNVMPTIYLEEYYDMYQREGDLETVAQMIVMVYEKVRVHKSWDVSRYLDYDKIKSLLACKLVNYEKNKKILESTPHVRLLDLAMVCYVLIKADDEWTSTMVVNNEQMGKWGITEDELIGAAMSNVEQMLPAKFEPLSDVVCGLLDEEDQRMLETEERMYVLSNERRSLGAVTIMYSHVLKMVGEMLEEDFYIIPSSIHEVIIVPASKAPSKKELEEMICEVNETQVSDEEVLSNHAYFYSCDMERLQV